MARHLADHHDLPLPADELIARKQAAFHDAVRASARSFPDVPGGLARLSAHYPVAIATNSDRVDADLMIATLGLDRYTSVSVTASDVLHRKPAPDIYRLAAERLSLDPRHCIALEDSGPGGESARSAGCYVIGLTPAVTMAQEWVDAPGDGVARAFALLGGGV